MDECDPAASPAPRWYEHLLSVAGVALVCVVGLPVHLLLSLAISEGRCGDPGLINCAVGGLIVLLSGIAMVLGVTILAVHRSTQIRRRTASPPSRSRVTTVAWALLAGAPLLVYCVLGGSSALGTMAQQSYAAEQCARVAALPSIESVEARIDPMVRQLSARLESAGLGIAVSGPQRAESSYFSSCGGRKPYQTGWTLSSRTAEGVVPDLWATWETASTITRDVSAEHGFVPVPRPDHPNRSVHLEDPDETTLSVVHRQDGSVEVAVHIAPHFRE